MEGKIKLYSMLIGAIGLLLIGISSIIVAANYRQETQAALALQNESLRQLKITQQGK